MRFLFALLVGRLVRFAGKFMHRSTNLPGQIALKICPDLLTHLTVQGKVIAVTGSNGKTTTSNLIAHILRRQGYRVVNNTEGSNLTSGIATTLLCACTLGGRLNCDFVVLEVDERYARFVFRDFPLDYFLINNLLRDQVVRNGNPDLVKEKIEEAIRPTVTLILNANDPISQTICPQNPRVYFGLARTSRSTEQSVHLTHDCKVCPFCFAPMDYAFFHYNHIGDFRCSGCGYHTPQAEFVGDQVDFQTGAFTINGLPVTVSYPTTFHVFNTVAAAAVCCTAGVPLEQVLSAAATFSVSRERYEQFPVGDRTAVLMMTKQNPVSLDQSISYVLEQAGEKTVVLFINNVLYLENKDISWLYDVSFERLIGQVEQVVCAGSRAYDAAVRLRLAGFSPESLLIETHLPQVRSAILSTRGTIYILAASAFGNEDGILEVLKNP